MYGWKEPTLSIGYSQSLDREIDRTRLVEEGVPCVRRPTGGRAILHEEELTYSVIAPVSHPLFEGGLKSTFSAISGALLKGLMVLGLENARINRDKKTSVRSGHSISPSCFTLLNHCEITVEDRKLVGSAQRRTHTAFLQHGSILIRISRDRLNSVLKFSDPQHREQNLEKLKQSTVTLSEVLTPVPTFSEVQEALRKGFESHFPGQWTSGVLSTQELALVDSLLSESMASISEGVAHE